MEGDYETNMKIQNVALVGAGAIGAYFIWGLADKLVEHFCVIANGERKDRLKKEGIVINDKHYDLNVKEPCEVSDIDLLLISTKYGALPQILDDIKQMVSAHTTVVSLLNGIDSEQIIGAKIGAEHMIYSLMRISSERKGNSIFFDPSVTPGLFFGELGTLERTERILAIEDLLKDTVIGYHFVPDILTDQWTKFATNISFNLPQAVLSVGAGAYADSEHVKFLSKKLWEEVASVAAAKGITLPAFPGIADRIRKNARFSTLQDLDAKRQTETDMFVGVMVRIGKELQISVPYCEYTFHAIKALEEKNEGKFDY